MRQYLRVVLHSENKRQLLTALTVLIVLKTADSTAAVLHVPQEYKRIREAIKAAKDSDTVLVAPGIYRETNIRIHGKSITVKSQKGPEVTIVEADRIDEHIFVVDGNDGPRTKIQGFTVRYGHTEYGGGLYIYGSSPTIEGNIFDGNFERGGGYGAAIAAEGDSGGVRAEPLIVNNIFRNNDCDGQFFSGVVTGYNNASPRIYDNLFENNACAAISMVLPPYLRAEVANNTMVHNYAGVSLFAVSDTYLQNYRNNVISGNTFGLLVHLSDGFHDPTWRNNLVYGNDTDYEGIQNQTALNGNRSAPVSFVDPALGNFRLNADSSAIDAGAGPTPALLATDIDGRTRVLDGDMDGSAVIDMGAFEFRHAVGGTVTGTGPLQVVCKNQRTKRRVTFEANDSPWDCEGAGLVVRAGEKVSAWTVGEVAGDQDVTGYAQGMTTARARCTNLETGRHVSRDLDGTTTWSCRDMGLAFRGGDRVRVWVQGAAY